MESHFLSQLMADSSKSDHSRFTVRLSGLALACPDLTSRAGRSAPARGAGSEIHEHAVTVLGGALPSHLMPAHGDAPTPLRAAITQVVVLADAAGMTRGTTDPTLTTRRACAPSNLSLVISLVPEITGQRKVAAASKLRRNLSAS
jgi:hypothetical protein